MIQHVNVKIFAESPERVDLAAALPVFHRWIREEACEELLIDVADYRHVPAGPGVVLVGHEANYSLDNSRGRLGLLYNRKAPVDAPAEEQLARGLRAALAACRRLEAEPEFEGRLKFSENEIEITINDRALAPNNEETFRELESALAVVLGGREFKLERAGSPRERLRVAVRTEARPSGSVRNSLIQREDK